MHKFVAGDMVRVVRNDPYYPHVVGEKGVVTATHYTQDHPYPVSVRLSQDVRPSFKDDELELVLVEETINPLEEKSPKAPAADRREELLNEALGYVTNDRQNSYGKPEDNFRRIAAFWSSYLGVPVENHDVANMMILMKVARLMQTPGHKDSWVDIAGYAACGWDTIADA